MIVTQAAETPLPFEYAGRVVGFRNVEVRPRVGGLLLTREYVEGAKVKEGDVLFRIDPATYEVALSRAEAQAAAGAGDAASGRGEFQTRSSNCSRRRSPRSGSSTMRSPSATRRARACSRPRPTSGTRELNLDYTTVVAPASGVTALQSPPEGTLIQAQQTLLTTITQLDPAYVKFTFTDSGSAGFLQEIEQAARRPIVAEDLTVELHFGDGAIYPHPGTVDTRSRRGSANRDHPDPRHLSQP